MKTKLLSITTGLVLMGLSLTGCMSNGTTNPANIAPSANSAITTSGSAGLNLSDAVTATGSEAPAVTVDRVTAKDVGVDTSANMEERVDKAVDTFMPSFDVVKAQNVGFETMLSVSNIPTLQVAQVDGVTSDVDYASALSDLVSPGYMDAFRSRIATRDGLVPMADSNGYLVSIDGKDYYTNGEQWEVTVKDAPKVSYSDSDASVRVTGKAGLLVSVKADTSEQSENMQCFYDYGFNVTSTPDNRYLVSALDFSKFDCSLVNTAW